MKYAKYTLFLLACMCACGVAKASPYIRLLGPDNYHVYDGALFSSKDGVGATQNTTVIALLTHSPKDGSLIPGFNETWAPFVLGGSNGGGNTTINAGPLVNVGPQMQHWLLLGLEALAPESLGNFKSLLAPPKSGSAVDVTFSFGAMANAELIQNGQLAKTFKDVFRDPVRYFAGPALHF